VTGPSNPRREHAGAHGARWERSLVTNGEQYAPECTASIRGTCLAEAQSETACDTEAGECIHAAPSSFAPAANRETRRAARRNR
jgi:hypothetical protein